MFAEFGALIKATFIPLSQPMATTARRWTELSSRAVTAWGDELTAEHSSDDVPVGLLLSELDGIINHLSTNNSKMATQKQQHVDDRALWAAEASDLTRERDELASRVKQSISEASLLETELADARDELKRAKADAADEASKLREDAEQARGALLRASSSAAQRFLGRLVQSGSHRTLAFALSRWREACRALSDALDALVSGNRSRAIAIMLTAHTGGETSLRLLRLGGALRSWAAFAGEMERTEAEMRLGESSETTRMVRQCYATDKLGIALCVAGPMTLRSGWVRWCASAAALDHELRRDETEILRHELSAELRQNAELQQRITSLEMSHDETRKLIPSPKAVAAEEEARHKFERELREAKRRASVAQGEADSLAEELAASQRKYDKMKSAHDALQRLSKAVPDRSSAEDLAMIKALQSEVTMLSRFSEMASGAHRFARWRLFVSAMKRKRAEHRAATAAAARRPAIAPPELLEQLQARRGGAKRPAVLALVRGCLLYT